MIVIFVRFIILKFRSNLCFQTARQKIYYLALITSLVLVFAKRVFLSTLLTFTEIVVKVVLKR
jgi:hypothetical protein